MIPHNLTIHKQFKPNKEEMSHFPKALKRLYYQLIDRDLTFIQFCSSGSLSFILHFSTQTGCWQHDNLKQTV